MGAACALQPRYCEVCTTARAMLRRPKTGQSICRDCFFKCFEDEVHRTIVDNHLFSAGERVAIAASGGKGRVPHYSDVACCPRLWAQRRKPRPWSLLWACIRRCEVVCVCARALWFRMAELSQLGDRRCWQTPLCWRM